MESQRYSTSSYAYFKRAKHLTDDFEEARQKLFYIAYELRCSIEAFLYEYLCFYHDDNLSRKLKKLYKAKDLTSAIRNVEPDIEKRIEFVNIVYAVMDMRPMNVPVPDMDKLGLFYGQIGNFMHIQKNAMDSDGAEIQWGQLEKLVKDALSFMHQSIYPQKTRLKLSEEGELLFEDFKANRKTEEQIKTLLKEKATKYIDEIKIGIDKRY
jgi:hypothetical protein